MEEVLAALPLHTDKRRAFNPFLGGAGMSVNNAAGAAHLPNSRQGANRRVAKVGIWQ
jgi:hypothetical protein